MIYSASKNFLFIHIPKTAGTSIRKLLEPYGGNPGILNFTARRLESLRSLCKATQLYKFRTYDAHTRFDQVEKIIPANELNRCLKFCVVRNPYDRAVSFYHHILAHPEHPWFEKVKSFENFASMALNFHKIGEPSQISYIKNSMNELAVDQIIHFENLGSEFQDLCSRLSIGGSLTHSNRNKHRHWTEYYTEDVRKAVYSYYKEDFIKLGYPESIKI